MSPEERLARASKARALLTSDIYAESFDAVRAELLRKWEQSPVRDTDGREYLFLMLKALNDAKGYLEQAMNDEKVVIHTLDEQRRLKIIG